MSSSDSICSRLVWSWVRFGVFRQQHEPGVVAFVEVRLCGLLNLRAREVLHHRVVHVEQPADVFAVLLTALRAFLYPKSLALTNAAQDADSRR